MGEKELSHGILTKRATAETWSGLLHGFVEEPFEVTLTAYAIEKCEAGAPVVQECPLRAEAIAKCADIASICGRFGFTQATRPCPSAMPSEGPRSPFDNLPARLLTFTHPSATVRTIAAFATALRHALEARVRSGVLARCGVDGWGSWRLVPLLRYENYYDFDPEAPFRFYHAVPPYECIASLWGLGSPRGGGGGGGGDPPSSSSSGDGPVRRSLVLDLDETLIHTEVEPIEDADFVFTLASPDGCGQHMYVRTRPHAHHFLEEAAKRFEVIVFTASERPYAEHVLRHLDPHGLLVEHVLCREDCTYIEGEFVKDLGTLQRDLDSCVLVDNRPEMYCYHPDNGIPISSWFEDRRDCELLRLLPSLHRIGAPRVTPDVRAYVRQHWRTFEHVARVNGGGRAAAATPMTASDSCLDAVPLVQFGHNGRPITAAHHQDDDCEARGGDDGAFYPDVSDSGDYDNDDEDEAGHDCGDEDDGDLDGSDSGGDIRFEEDAKSNNSRLLHSGVSDDGVSDEEDSSREGAIRPLRELPAFPVM